MAWVITLLTLVPPAGMTERDAILKVSDESKLSNNFVGWPIVRAAFRNFTLQPVR